jgi:hypothetical protein
MLAIVDSQNTFPLFPIDTDMYQPRMPSHFNPKQIVTVHGFMGSSAGAGW